MTKLWNQTLLQSTFAETLRLYVSVCVTRRPDFAEAQILDYRIPKDKLTVISTALAHMDKRNWNLGLPLAIVIVLLAVVAFFLYQLIRKHKLGFFHLQHAAKGTPLPEMDAVGPQSLAELDITHYELNHPDAPRHELP